MQFVDDVVLALVREVRHIGHVQHTVFVERCRDGFLRRIDVLQFLRGEGHGVVEEVGLYKPAVLATFQGQHVPSRCIHQDHPHVLPVVQVAVHGREGIVVAVKFLAQLVIRLLVVLFVGIQLLIDVTHGDILADAVGQLLRDNQGDEGGTRGSDLLQMSDVSVLILHHGAVTVVCLHLTLEGLGFYQFCLGGTVLLRLGFRLSLLSGFGIRIGLDVLLSSLQQLAATLRSQVHHHLIEAVDGRVLFPIQRVIDGQLLVDMTFLLHLCLLLLQFPGLTLLLPFLLWLLRFNLWLWWFLHRHTPKVKE